ncbi:MAG TPA: MarR family winged helix-turn-helix transcriptional regulator [Solirubrobacteraceae bacterium]|jgi:DNA-binding MarR family transcriptional regulator|nr:MarR family winged helix-turn-helix transcriptional regulator [Solirubrobacteraceae bacterium]
MHSENCSGTTSAPILLARLSKQVMRRAHPENLGMDLRLLMALSFVGDHDGEPQQELVDALCMDAKNVVLLLNELEDIGYLVRRRDPEDRRRHRVQITEAGRDALARAREGMDAIENEILQALDADERATLLKLLTRALQGVEHIADEGEHPSLATASS